VVGCGTGSGFFSRPEHLTPGMIHGKMTKTRAQGRGGKSVHSDCVLQDRYKGERKEGIAGKDPKELADARQGMPVDLILGGRPLVTGGFAE